jgi:hypothetical protein
MCLAINHSSICEKDDRIYPKKKKKDDRFIGNIFRVSIKAFKSIGQVI